MILSPNEIAWVAAKAGWKGDDIAVAVAVALAESRGNTEALGWVPANPGTAPGTTPKPASGNYDHGLWQISSLWHGALLAQAGHLWRDPLVNAGMAHQIWTEAGGKWSPWSTYKGGQYQPLLPFGVKAALYPWAPPLYEPPLSLSGTAIMNGTVALRSNGPMV